VYESDRALVDRMLAGEQRAFDEFYAANADRLAAFAARRSGLDSASLEDIVQNTLIKALRSLRSYRAEATLLTWLSSICRHELADAQRTGRRRPAHDSIDSNTSARQQTAMLRAAPEHEPEAELESFHMNAAVIETLDALPANYAVVLEAKYGDGMSVEALAQLLDATPIAAQSLLARARLAFRSKWAQRLDQASRSGLQA
jgi:RNA polymerase sigma-70 factor, ECF subfamily